MVQHNSDSAPLYRVPPRAPPLRLSPHVHALSARQSRVYPSTTQSARPAPWAHACSSAPSPALTRQPRPPTPSRHAPGARPPRPLAPSPPPRRAPSAHLPPLFPAPESWALRRALALLAPRARWRAVRGGRAEKMFLLPLPAAARLAVRHLSVKHFWGPGPAAADMTKVRGRGSLRGRRESPARGPRGLWGRSRPRCSGLLSRVTDIG